MLAIGDGANDVSMITEAHIGIGIRGLEGQQAAKASDFAICEFKHLRRLLLFTGSESYRKNCYLILFNFYKNQIYIGVTLFYGFLTGFSGQYLYD
jgi:phospholipid-transporting ATPase